MIDLSDGMQQVEAIIILCGILIVFVIGFICSKYVKHQQKNKRAKKNDLFEAKKNLSNLIVEDIENNPEHYNVEEDTDTDTVSSDSKNTE